MRYSLYIGELNICRHCKPTV